MKKVLVVGAGPAGMMAAYHAAKSGADVTIFERNPIIGKKLRITGKGRCNITNAQDPEDIIKNIYKNGNFMYSGIYSFSNDMAMDLFKSYGLKIKIERGQRVFPESDKAIDVVNTFDRMIKDAGVKLILNNRVKSIEVDKDKNILGLRTAENDLVSCDSIILATGGKSYPLTGTTGDGYKMSKKLGHTCTELSPSLVGLETMPRPSSDLVGLNLRNVSIKLLKNAKPIYSDFGELEFRDYGIDGPIIKSASCYISDKGDYEVELDLKPALSFEKLDKRLQRDFEEFSNKEFENSLVKLLPKSIIGYIIDESGIDRKKLVHQITRQERHNLVGLIKSIKFHIKSTRPIDEAIVTSGGINVKEINPSTMESKIVKNLYFCGEIIDVDAFTGGYNLQIAYSTAYLAGINAAQANGSGI